MFKITIYKRRLKINSIIIIMDVDIKDDDT